MKKPVRVLHVLVSLKVGGAERVVANLMRESRPAIEASAVCLNTIGLIGDELRNDGFRVDCLKRRPGIDWRLFFSLAWYCREHKIEVLHAHGESPWFYCALSTLLNPFARIPCITTIHGYGGGDRTKLGNRNLWRFLSFFTKMVITVSQDFHDELGSVGLSQNKLLTIYNGIASRSHTTGVGKSGRKALGLDSGDFVVGIVARLSAIKNHELLIKAIARLRRTSTRRSFKLLIVGGGPERRLLEDLTSELALNDSVVFCGEQSDVYPFYSLFDVFVLPSYSEGISMTILEAMVSGVPVVASAVGGNTEIINHGSNGLLFPSGNLEALCHELEKLAEDETLSQKIIDRARGSIAERFSMDAMTLAYNKLYFDIRR